MEGNLYMMDERNYGKEKDSGLTLLKKRRCHNCKFAGVQFKVGKLTHLHCMNMEIYSKEDIENGEISAWETLRVFSASCNNHKFKDERNETV